MQGSYVYKCLIHFISAYYDMVTMWQELEVVERRFWTSSLKMWVQGQVSHLLISWLGLGVFTRLSFLVSKVHCTQIQYQCVVDNTHYCRQYNKCDVWLFVFMSNYVTMPRILLGWILVLNMFAREYNTLYYTYYFTYYFKIILSYFFWDGQYLMISTLLNTFHLINDLFWGVNMVVFR